MRSDLHNFYSTLQVQWYICNLTSLRALQTSFDPIIPMWLAVVD